MTMKSSIVTNRSLRLPLAGLLTALYLLVAAGNMASAATLIVTNKNHNPILVELYREGKPIRSLELARTALATPASAKLEGLPPGQYEMHCSSSGFGDYGKVIKRFYLSDEGETQVYADLNFSLPIDKKPRIVGNGPSLQEIWQLVQELQQDKSDLQARVERLEAEINQLKGKVPER